MVGTPTWRAGQVIKGLRLPVEDIPHAVLIPLLVHIHLELLFVVVLLLEREVMLSLLVLLEEFELCSVEQISLDLSLPALLPLMYQLHLGLHSFVLAHSLVHFVALLLVELSLLFHLFDCHLFTVPFAHLGLMHLLPHSFSLRLVHVALEVLIGLLLVHQLIELVDALGVEIVIDLLFQLPQHLIFIVIFVHLFLKVLTLLFFSSCVFNLGPQMVVRSKLAFDPWKSRQLRKAHR